MADTKISALTSGTATSGDAVPIARAGTNFRVTVDSIAALAPQGTVTSVSGTGTKNGLTLSGTVTGSGNITLGGTFTATASEISDFNSASRAQTEAALIAGSNITITPGSSGATRTLTIAASGGGGGSSYDALDTIIWQVAPNTSSPNTLGLGVSSSAVYSTAISSGTFYDASPRIIVLTSTAADSIGHINGSATAVFRGNGSTTPGGFVYKVRVGIYNKQATGRAFFGLAPQANWVGTALITNQVNIVGLGFESGDTTMRVYHNDGTGTATVVDLGANFPVSAKAVYELTLDCTPNGSIAYTVERLDSAFTATGTLSTDLPATTTGLTKINWVSLGSTGGTGQGFDWMGSTLLKKMAYA